MSSKSNVGEMAVLRSRTAPAEGEAATSNWWTCPAWCSGNCTGGEFERLADGSSAFSGRLHEEILVDVTCADHRAVRVRVIAERCDNQGESVPAELVMLYVEREPLPEIRPDVVDRLTQGLSDEACRRQLAAFLAGAYDSMVIELSPQLRRTIAAALLAVDTAAKHRPSPTVNQAVPLVRT